MTQRLEDRFQALNLIFGLFQMLFKAMAQLLRRGSFGHFRKCFDQLVLSTIQVLQFVDIEFLKAIVWHWSLHKTGGVGSVQDLLQLGPRRPGPSWAGSFD